MKKEKSLTFLMRLFILVFFVALSSILCLSYSRANVKEISNPKQLHEIGEDSDQYVYDTVWFGSYAQDDFTGKQKNSIRWKVMEVKDGVATLMANQVLDVKPFNDGDTKKTGTDVNWYNSTLRSWLNGYSGDQNVENKSYTKDSFIDTAFSEAEKKALVLSDVCASDNSDGYKVEKKEVKEDVSTKDYVYILNKEECEKDEYKYVFEHKTDGNSTYVELSNFVKYNNQYIYGIMQRNITYGAIGGTNAPLNTAVVSQREIEYYNNYRKMLEDGGYYQSLNGTLPCELNGIMPVVKIKLSETNAYKYAGTINSYGYSDYKNAQKEPVSIDYSKVELDKQNEEDFVIENGVLTEYKGTQKVVVIPEGVTEIADSMKMNTSFTKNINGNEIKITNKSYIEYVIFPKSLKRIGNNAFYSCSSLHYVTFFDIENSLCEEIGNSAFSSCYYLNDVELPDTISKLGEKAFDYTSLFSLMLPKSVSVLTPFAFYNSNLKYLCLHDGLEAISDDALNGAGLRDIKLPDGVKSFGKRAFKDNKLYQFELPDCMEEIPEGFCEGTSIDYLKIGENVKVIGKEAFKNCLTENFYIPDTVESIGEGAFSGCTYITELEYPKLITKIPDYANSGCTKLKVVSFRGEITDIGDYAFENSGLSMIELPDSVVNIGKLAFSESSIRKFTVPKNLESLGVAAFLRAKDLTYFSFGENVKLKQIPLQCFKETYIKEINIPDSIESIGASAFYYAYRLQRLPGGKNIKELGSSAFYGCSKLVYAPFSDCEITTLGTSVFENSGIYYCDMSKWKIEELPNGTFKNTKNLITVKFNTKDKLLKRICRESFCSSHVQGLDFPDGLESIDEYSISGNSYEAKDENGDTVRKGLSHITIPDSIKGIGAMNFYLNDILNYIDLPENITYITSYFLNYQNTDVERILIARGDITGCDSLNKAYWGKMDNLKIYGKVDTKLYEVAMEAGIPFFDITKNTPPKQPEWNPVIPSYDELVNANDLVVNVLSQTGNYYYYDGNSSLGAAVEIEQGGVYHISMKDGLKSTTDTILVKCDQKEDITIILDNVNISPSASKKYDFGPQGQDIFAAIWIENNCPANVTILVKGENNLTGNNSYPAICKWGMSGGKLIIDEYDDSGNNILKCDGKGSLQDIGVWDRSETESKDRLCNVIINGGIINASIGDEFGVNCEINGGVVNADKLGSFTVNGGVVNAKELNGDSKIIYKGGELSVEQGDACIYKDEKSTEKLTPVLINPEATVTGITVDGKKLNIDKKELESTDGIVKLYLSDEAHKVSVETDKGTKNYDVTFVEGLPVVPNNGKVSYSESQKLEIKNIGQKDSDFTVENLPEKVFYNGEPVTIQNLQIKYKNLLLKEGEDYTISYDNNRGVGDATIAINGIGRFKSTSYLHFKIEKNPQGTPTSTPVPTPTKTPKPTIKPTKTPYNNDSNSSTTGTNSNNRLGQTSIGNTQNTKGLSKGSTFYIAKQAYYYKVIGNKKVALISATRDKKSQTIPATVKYENVTYKVTKIANYTFYSKSKLKKVTIGSNITSIGKYAFMNCSKLKTIVVKTKKLKSKTVGSNAFAYINKKASVKVPKSKLKTYKKIFKKKGLKLKSQKVKK